MKLKIFGMLIAIGLILMVSGCIEEEKIEVEAETGETANLAIQVTDKVTEEFKHVNITFSEIKLHYQTEDEGESAWEIITSDSKTVDLIYLHLNDLNESLGVAEIPVGNYSKLWINVSKAVGVLNSTSEEVNITVPSNWLKIQQLHLFNLTKGNHTITIDIDLESSIHTFHGGEEYKFIPVISSMNHQHEKQLKFKINEQSQIKNLVGNRAPAIDITIDDEVIKNKFNAEADTNYTFNASGTLDLDGDNLTYAWDFGDGATSNESTVVHQFANQSQPYTVTLTVNDGTDENTETIKVQISRTSGNNGNGNGQG